MSPYSVVNDSPLTDSALLMRAQVAVVVVGQEETVHGTSHRSRGNPNGEGRQGKRKHGDD